MHAASEVGAQQARAPLESGPSEQPSLWSLFLSRTEPQPAENRPKRQPWRRKHVFPSGCNFSLPVWCLEWRVSCLVSVPGRSAVMDRGRASSALDMGSDTGSNTSSDMSSSLLPDTSLSPGQRNGLPLQSDVQANLALVDRTCGTARKNSSHVPVCLYEFHHLRSAINWKPSESMACACCSGFAAHALVSGRHRWAPGHFCSPSKERHPQCGYYCRAALTSCQWRLALLAFPCIKHIKSKEQKLKWPDSPSLWMAREELPHATETGFIWCDDEFSRCSFYLQRSSWCSWCWVFLLTFGIDKQSNLWPDPITEVSWCAHSQRAPYLLI